MTTKIKYFTKEEAMMAVTKNGNELEFCTPEIRNNEEVVRTAIEKNGKVLTYASNELKSNKVLVLKALNEGLEPLTLNGYPSEILSDLEVMCLAVEKDTIGLSFSYAEGEAALNKELAAKALVKWGRTWGDNALALWGKLHPTLKEFFPRRAWYKKAQSYLYQLEQERQAEMVSGGSKDEDGVVW